MNTALLDALTTLHCGTRNDICEDLRLPGQHISESHKAHAGRVLASAEKQGLIRELEAAIEGTR
ncbi:hypothetical protein uav_076 [Pseudomonas phage UAVern]|uniref:Uncharacterized protein n=1 Tax=Pseudomonas phage UAVern TaxID=2856997 RepID=A0A975UWB8_9CAUD|nr:hypothetical protein uav_076 [Pseudomonas phage UAVern]